MSDTELKTRPSVREKLERPKRFQVILLNDDYTPAEFVVLVLKGEFRLDESRAELVMQAAHQKGASLVSVYPRDIAETKVSRATETAQRMGYPLKFLVEPEE